MDKQTPSLSSDDRSAAIAAAAPVDVKKKEEPSSEAIQEATPVSATNPSPKPTIENVDTMPTKTAANAAAEAPKDLSTVSTVNADVAIPVAISTPAKPDGALVVDDDLARELEEIEGSKKDENDAPEKADDCPTTQKTSDLLKDLESDASSVEPATSVTVPRPISEAIATETAVASTPNAITAEEEVDSTTESLLLKRKHTVDDATDGNDAKKLNIEEPQASSLPQPLEQLPTNSKEPDHAVATPTEEPMDVDDDDDDGDEATADTNDAVQLPEDVTAQKEEAITSTSSEVEKSSSAVAVSGAQVSATEAVEMARTSNASVSGSSTNNVDSKESIDVIETKATELPDEPVSSTDDLSPEAAVDDMDESTEARPVNDKEADACAAGNATTAPKVKESAAAIAEQCSDSTVSKTIETELRAAESQANNKIDEKNVSVAPTSDGDGNKKPANNLLANTMNNGDSGSMVKLCPVSPAAVNSTAAPKKPDVKLENVSKIDEHKKMSNAADTTPAASKTSDALTSTVSSDSDPQSSDKVTHHANILKTFNGLAEAVDDGEMEVDADTGATNTAVKSISITNGTNVDSSTPTITEEPIQYDISVWYEESAIQYMAIEKMDRKKLSHSGSPVADGSDAGTTVTDDGSPDKTTSTSNGNAGSSTALAAAAGPHDESVASSNSSPASHKMGDDKFTVPALPSQPRTSLKSVTGVVALCNYMIDHFTKLKRAHTVDDDDSAYETQYTPTTTGRGKGAGAGKKNLTKAGASNAASSPDVTAKKRGSTSTKRAHSDTEDEPKSKQIKTAAAAIEEPSYSVLARWVDKMYYAGRVTQSKPGNKYVVLFEDGASKTLPQESIVFGEDNVLPLLDQSVHALIAKDTYEPGLVTLVNTDGETVMYTVTTESKTVTVTASDIYLEEDQAKMIQQSMRELGGSGDVLKSPDTPTTGGKRTGRPSMKLEESQTSSGGRARGAKKLPQPSTTPEPGFSGNVGGRSGRRTKRPEPPRCFSESSDISDHFELDSAPNSPDSALEAIEGVQPELQKTPKESEFNKMCLMADYLANDRTKNFDDILGPLPTSKTLFRNKHFILTCTIPMKLKTPSFSAAATATGGHSNGGTNGHHITSGTNGNCVTAVAYTNGGGATTNGSDVGHIDDEKIVGRKQIRFSMLPFVKDHLRLQIEAGGGKVYNHFEDIPKNKYKQCLLIAAHPCTTAKYVQCLAADIAAVSHEWIIQSCQKKGLADVKRFALPSGWSIIEDRYKRWAIGRAADHRKNSTPLSNTVVLLASQNKEFTEFWTRVCKLARATVRLIRTLTDITPSTDGYMLTDPEFPEDVKLKAEHFGIPIVSTVWVVQSLIMGKVCVPTANPKLMQYYQDDDF